MKVDAAVRLDWAGRGLEFQGGTDGGPSVTVDGNGAAGASPMQSLLLALAGCMGADLVEIVQKMRVPLEGLTLRLEGERAPEPPRRYTRLRLTVEASGSPAEAEPKLRHALALSRETYCSVLHTLKSDLELSTELVLR